MANSANLFNFARYQSVVFLLFPSICRDTMKRSISKSKGVSAAPTWLVWTVFAAMGVLRSLVRALNATKESV